MRKLHVLACAFIAAAAVAASSAGAADPTTGVLSVDQGRGVVTLDIRGFVLGRLGNGTLRVTDHTPRDPFTETVKGRFVEERLGPRTVVYRGAGLRFLMLGGKYRIGVRGSGIDISAHGRGAVSLDGEPRTLDEPTGIYSVSGVDCTLEPARCSPLPDEREDFILGQPEPAEPRPARLP